MLRVGWAKSSKPANATTTASARSRMVGRKMVGFADSAHPTCYSSCRTRRQMTRAKKRLFMLSTTIGAMVLIYSFPAHRRACNWTDKNGVAVDDAAITNRYDRYLFGYLPERWCYRWAAPTPPQPLRGTGYVVCINGPCLSAETYTMVPDELCTMISIVIGAIITATAIHGTQKLGIEQIIWSK